MGTHGMETKGHAGGEREEEREENNEEAEGVWSLERRTSKERTGCSRTKKKETQTGKEWHHFDNASDGNTKKKKRRKGKRHRPHTSACHEKERKTKEGKKESQITVMKSAQKNSLLSSPSRTLSTDVVRQLENRVLDSLAPRSAENKRMGRPNNMLSC